MSSRTQKIPPKVVLFILLALVAGYVPSVSSAAACTYREAIMALETGNEVRGMALMRMASRDGDQRAVSYLLQQNDEMQLPVFAKKPSLLITAKAEVK